MINYNQAIEKIDSLLTFGSRPGLDRIKKLLSLMGDPQNDLKCVHVAGTNGKGSVCNMLASILTAAGYKTGLFTSPHITDFCERIQINGSMISHEDLEELTEKYFPLVLHMRENGDIITEFEFVTAIAFQYFKDQNCDVVVLETGMGGRFDATNVIPTPLCSVITSISLDHTAILGNTLTKIAFEKSGIIKENGITVFLPQEDEVNAELCENAEQRNNSIIKAEMIEEKATSIDGTVVIIDETEINVPLLGHHQMKNLGVVMAAVDALRQQGFNIGTNHIKAGVEAVRVPARFEILCREPLIIADGAHNPDGMRTLADSIDRYLNDKNIICVIGMLKDKESREAAKNLIGRVVEIVATTVPDTPRTRTADDMRAVLSDIGLKAHAIPNAQEAVKYAVRKAAESENTMVLICGSLYLSAHTRGVCIDFANSLSMLQYD
ncbi:MAG: bifunctional folylpolyglutamate synthase/dihydrofolate synthase [Clostridia bacterium]|nr:bifunctional folylpolyglutamate synthase/dihydrofolate synthase [Clostridia bacterium]